MAELQFVARRGNDISNVHFENKKVYLVDPHSITILFADKHYTINDEYFNLFTQSDDYDKIITEYNKLFIQKYSSLLAEKNSLNQTDLEILDRFEKVAMRDW